MSTKVRLALSLDEYSFQTISNLSRDLGKTKSAVVIELMHLMGPALNHVSACKQMIDEGLKNTGEQAFYAFLQGMQADFDNSLSDAEALFDGSPSVSGKEAEHMQADESGDIRKAV